MMDPTLLCHLCKIPLPTPCSAVATSTNTAQPSDPCSRAEVEVLEERVVMPDPDSAVLLRKKVLAPGAAAAAAGARRAGKAAAGVVLYLIL